MNILYHQINELCINELRFEKRLEFYQEHYYDNIYIVSKDGIYLGFYNYQIEVGGKEQAFDSIKKNTSTEFVFEWFKNHPGQYRVPVVENSILYGEYYDASLTGQILYKKIEDRVLELFPIFKNEICERYEGKRIGILGDRIEYILSVFPKAVQCKDNYKKFDQIIDTQFIPQFRKVLGNIGDNVVSPFEILLPILIEKVITYYKTSNVNFLFINGMMKKAIENVTNEERKRLHMTLEQTLLDMNILYKFCKSDPLSLKKLIQHKYDLNQCSRIVSNGIHNILLDKLEEDYSIIDGKRYTTDIPINPTSKIHIFGPCVVMGLCVADKNTICSILQREINRNGYNIEVVNHGLAYGNDQLNDLLSMMATPVREGDSVIWFSGFDDEAISILRNLSVQIIEAKECVYNLKDWFLDNAFHCNAEANQRFAQAIYSCLKDRLTNGSDKNQYSPINALGIDLHFNPEAILDSHELKVYKDYLKKFRCEDSIKRKGAVVLNANPCTLGHVFLINKALRCVDILYVFLVEESKGSFAFLDREYMLKQTFKYNKRVKILTGGNVMTSEKIFPEYFQRNSEPSKISLVLTHKVFGCVVGSILGISYRFFGTEPTDKVTKALNESAKKILPDYGIEPIFFNRFKINGQYVSASVVRNLFQNTQYDELAKLVPFPTYRRLLEIAHDYNDKTIKLYYENTNYSLNAYQDDKDQLPELSEFGFKLNSYCYPGMIEKFGCEIDGEKYIIKIARTQSQRISLYSEKIGNILCHQLGVVTSEIQIVVYDGNLAQMSKNWKIDESSQFFPLAAYYEELLDNNDYNEVIRFKYEIFKKIVMAKCAEEYEEVLSTFWKVSIIDYLMCNARSAGNIGFLSNGAIKLTPNYDNSTWLESTHDTRFLSTDFPQLLMEFDLENNSAFNVLSTVDDPYLKSALKFSKAHLNLFNLYDSISSAEEHYLFDVVNYRYSKLF